MPAFKHLTRKIADRAPNKISFDFMRAKYSETDTLSATTPAVGAALPQFGAVVQEGETGDVHGRDYVCSGTFLLIGGNTVGCLIRDAEDAVESEYLIEARQLFVPLAAGQTPAIGEEIYWRASDGLWYDNASGPAAGYHRCGIVREAAETNPANLPAGDWVLIKFVNSGAVGVL